MDSVLLANAKRTVDATPFERSGLVLGLTAEAMLTLHISADSCRTPIPILRDRTGMLSGRGY